MKHIYRALLTVAMLFAFCGLTAASQGALSSEVLTDVRYANPVDRYGHFALGKPHEYSRLIASTSSGRKLTLELPANEVFEDLAPRLVKLAPDEPEEILSIVSRRDSGARLVMIRLGAGGLSISAQSPAIGKPMRWLNPVGVVDLDGDGHAEIAVVITPHLGGPLKIYRRSGAALVEIAALAGFSNHVYGTAELALSMPMSINGRTHLLVPDTTRRYLRVIALQSRRLTEIRRCELAEPITGAIKQISLNEVSVDTQHDRQILNPNDCAK
jgi:hypothetical protein